MCNQLKTAYSSQNGFSILELLVAVTILSISLLALAGLQSTAISGSSAANRLSIASALAQEVMEDIGSWKISDARLHADAENIVYDLDPATEGTSRFVPGSGTYSATYSTAINNPISGVTRITIYIHSTSRSAVTKTTSLVGFHRVL